MHVWAILDNLHILYCWNYVICNFLEFFLRQILENFSDHEIKIGEPWDTNSKLGCGLSPHFLWKAVEWPSSHLIWNNLKMDRDITLGIFVKGPWYTTYLYNSQIWIFYSKHFFFWKSKFVGKCEQSQLFIIAQCHTGSFFLNLTGFVWILAFFQIYLMKCSLWKSIDMSDKLYLRLVLVIVLCIKSAKDEQAKLNFLLLAKCRNLKILMRIYQGIFQIR